MNPLKKQDCLRGAALFNKWLLRPGAVAHACNPSTQEAEAGESQGEKFETSLANMVKSRLYLKYKN